MFLNRMVHGRTMAFLDDTGRFGALAMVIGILVIAGGVLSGLCGHPISCASGIIEGALILSAGIAIVYGSGRGGMEWLFPEGADSKFGVVVGYTMVVGFALIVNGVFSLFEETGIGVAGIVIGLLMAVMGAAVANDRKTIVDRIVWLVLAVFYFLAIAASIVEACSGQAHFVTGVCGILIHLLAFAYLFDADVKKRFRMPRRNAQTTAL